MNLTASLLQTPIIDANGRITPAWQRYFSAQSTVISQMESVVTTGATAIEDSVSLSDAYLPSLLPLIPVLADLQQDLLATQTRLLEAESQIVRLRIQMEAMELQQNFSDPFMPALQRASEQLLLAANVGFTQ